MPLDSKLFKCFHGFYFRSKKLLLLVIICGVLILNIKSQIVSSTDTYFEKISIAKDNIQGLEADIEVSLEYLYDEKPQIKKFHCVIFKEPTTKLGFSFYAHDVEMNYKQWLCDTTMFVLDPNKMNIQAIDFIKYGFKDYIKNEWNLFFVEWFAHDFPYSIIRNANNKSYKWLIHSHDDELELKTEMVDDHENIVISKSYIFDSQTFFLSEMSVYASYEGATQTFKYKIDNIHLLSPGSFCSEVEKYPDYKVSEFVPSVRQPLILTDTSSVLPSFTLKEVGGKKIKTEAGSELKLVYCWYISCYPCRKASLAIDSVYRLFDKSKLSVFGLNYNDDPKGIRKHLRRTGLSFPVVHDSKQYLQSIGISSYPTIIIMDRDNKILVVYEGYSSKLFDNISDFISTYLGT